ncbi:MAG TPA: ThuA domain-containing protein [Kofleriaceae bacterium]|nr:ThuA domain-containing protein [Kofleriaceae bacterium]
MMRSALLAVALAGCAAPDSAPDAADPPPEAVIDAQCDGAPAAPRVLVFSRENLWTHESTPVARQMFLELCASRGFSVIASRDPQVFVERLRDTDVVVFGVTSGEVLDDPSRAAFEAWVRAGGGVIGIHAASATEVYWPFYTEMLGAQFRGHAEHFTGRASFEHRTHPVLASVTDATVERFDEWYSFSSHPEAAGVTVLLSLDEQTMPATYPDDLKMGYHAIAWAHEPFGARVVYTALGHYPEIYAEPWFRDSMADAVLWAARQR